MRKRLSKKRAKNPLSALCRKWIFVIPAQSDKRMRVSPFAGCRFYTNLNLKSIVAATSFPFRLSFTPVNVALLHLPPFSGTHRRLCLWQSSGRSGAATQFMNCVVGSRPKGRPANHVCRLRAGIRRIRAGWSRSRSVRAGSESPQDFHSLPAPRLRRALPALPRCDCYSQNEKYLLLCIHFRLRLV